MTQLRQEFISALRIRNYSPKTIKQYMLCVRHFAQYFNKSPELLGSKEIKQYLLYLIDEKQCGWSHYRQTVCGTEQPQYNSCPRLVMEWIRPVLAQPTGPCRSLLLIP
jgi:hypothetical protein